MKTTYTAWAMISIATLLGFLATALIAGCDESPSVSNQTSNRTSDAGDESSGDGQTGTGDKSSDDGQSNDKEKPIKGASKAVDKSANPKIVEGDWLQWGGTSYRNNTPVTGPVAEAWSIGEFDKETGRWEGAKNIKWVAALGSQSYGNPVVADGRVYVGTNNSNGYLKRYPYRVDLGCLVCFDESNGKLLWQHSSEKLPTGRVHDWEQQGICCAPYVEGKKLWFVSSRGHVVCVDTEGYYDGEDDGPVTNEQARIFNLSFSEEATAALDKSDLTDEMESEFDRVDLPLPGKVTIKAVESKSNQWTFKAKVGDSEREFKVRKEGPNLAFYKIVTPDDKFEADTIWTYDMMDELGVSQHNMCSCSITARGDIIYVNTSNGVDESHLNLPAPDAPSFIAMNKNNGEVLWTDKSPGTNILHGQWSSPTIADLGGVPQVIFGGGDGWVYSFSGDEMSVEDGKPKLLWKFDGNPKTSKWILGGRGTRNNIIATPVVHDGLVYVAVGQDPEHGEGIGHLWCIDPTKRMDGSDVSPELAVKIKDKEREPLEPRRLQAVIEADGEVAVDNPDSAVVWHYSEVDTNGDGRIDFEETMHRSCGTVAIKDDLLYIADFSGLFHCLDSKTGEVHWTYDMLAAAWGSPLIADGKVYIGDEDGDVCIFPLTGDPEKAFEEVDGDLKPAIGEIYMDNSVYSSPIVANGVLFIANRTHLFAIQEADEAAGK